MCVAVVVAAAAAAVMVGGGGSGVSGVSGQKVTIWTLLLGQRTHRTRLKHPVQAKRRAQYICALCSTVVPRLFDGSMTEASFVCLPWQRRWR
jgi:hypothetical protein